MAKFVVMTKKDSSNKQLISRSLKSSKRPLTIQDSLSELMNSVPNLIWGSLKFPVWALSITTTCPTSCVVNSPSSDVSSSIGDVLQVVVNNINLRQWAKLWVEVPSTPSTMRSSSSTNLEYTLCCTFQRLSLLQKSEFKSDWRGIQTEELISVSGKTFDLTFLCDEMPLLTF